jgi:hypothetical protein
MIQVILYNFRQPDKTCTISHVSIFLNLQNIDKEIDIIILGTPNPVLESWYQVYGFNISFSQRPIQDFFVEDKEKSGIFLCDYSTCFYPNFISIYENKINIWSPDSLLDSQMPIYIPHKFFNHLSFLFFFYLEDKEIYDIRLLDFEKKDYIIRQSLGFS